MSKLSVVLPAYNEELMVGKTCRVLAQVLTEAQIPYELVVVNDWFWRPDMGRNSEGRREGCECDRRSFFQKFRKGSSDFCRTGAGLWRCGGCHGL
ncbi:MAG: hypothetical protein ACLUTA_17560 [Blautia wexlerae]